ncbi:MULTISPECIES: MarR family winged helix-turn-helix transcriptional regulator [unclassified Paracoccus (in: a-proteobacteria)]|uniref:MarR family winged helix-turn-helix transcriptional regulator n=1 Tax=unclassified Paracoccus (in: a-proteobacteria) TaxID=2688777 RepID=UPI0012B3E331|nr:MULTISPECIES: MarR family winged helix-turn-helix transcriptional regulator [unclassified Paracoccus (in: a-proteobacteria)]UXU76640.1 MarR family winged helix-turn-helix transcriptional regulator [Paracoccus sp. SMMA_5]UXU82528.1 MarR family winged helix-turn-helix transcriptional regulator [Paracoccus sp. SMMA_5_TC]
MTFDLNQFIPYRLSVAAAAVSRRFAARYAAEAGLSIPEWRVLAHLGAAQAVSIRDITARVNLDKSVVSRAASRLERSGLVEKSGHQGDQRLISLQLTPAGQALMQRLTRIAEGFQAELLAELGDEATPLLRALERLGGLPHPTGDRAEDRPGDRIGQSIA